MDKDAFFWKVTAGELYQDGERVASATATALIRRMPPAEGR